jgi:hypothetical protein
MASCRLLLTIITFRGDYVLDEYFGCLRYDTYHTYVITYLTYSSCIGSQSTRFEILIGPIQF